MPEDDVRDELQRLQQQVLASVERVGANQERLRVIEEAMRFREGQTERYTENSDTVHRDHEKRLRALEKVAWALAGSSAATAAAAIASLIHSGAH